MDYCKNGGSCEAFSSSEIKCNCANGFTGSYCEKMGNDFSASRVLFHLIFLSFLAYILPQWTNF